MQTLALRRPEKDLLRPLQHYSCRLPKFKLPKCELPKYMFKLLQFKLHTIVVVKDCRSLNLFTSSFIGHGRSVFVQPVL